MERDTTFVVSLFLQGSKYPALCSDTAGAGDNFAAGFLCALLEGSSLFDCCRFAAATAALSISQMGASSRAISREQVDALLKKIS